MMKKLSLIIVASGLVLSACSTGNEEEENTKDKKQEKHMNNKSESKAADNMKRKKKNTYNNKYKKEKKITMTAYHMPSMKNAKNTGKVDYKIYAYIVNYTHTNCEKKVNKQKWVDNEEVADIPENGFKKGDTVKLEA